MIQIEVKKELGNDLVTRQQGKRLREMILAAWSDPPVVLDFQGLKINSVSFFDECFGQLALVYGEKDLKRIESRGLEKFDSALLQDIVTSRLKEAHKKSSR
jgi:hypothetical protein